MMLISVLTLVPGVKEGVFSGTDREKPKCSVFSAMRSSFTVNGTPTRVVSSTSLTSGASMKVTVVLKSI